ncbi:DUF6282 family protein [Cryptosporangium aurantiacum]|nr:DUF6282 family protein [Cryptosporangium aurantiacum]
MLSFVAKRDIVLATGHFSGNEITATVDAPVDAGVRRSRRAAP